MSGSAATNAERTLRLIALDWGTSSLRAYLLAADGDVLAERAERWRMMQTPDGDFAQAFRAIAGGRLPRSPGLPAVASGMIGSAQGWCEVR